MGSNFVNDDAIIFPSVDCLHDSSIGYSADFTANGEVDGWEYFDGIHTYGAWAGFLFGTLLTDYGIIGRYDVFRPVDAETHYNLRITMKYNPIPREGIHRLPNRAKVRWTTLDLPNYDSSKEKSFEMVADNKWHTYILNMGTERYWIGNVNNLRIWVATGYAKDGDEFFIRAIDILSTESHVCLNAACDKFFQYEHPCPWIGARATRTSSVHEADELFNIVDRTEFIINVNDYGNEIVKVGEVLNATGQEAANKIARAMSRVDIGGYAEVQIVYTDSNEFKIYSGTKTPDSSVVVVDNELSRYLGFFDAHGNNTSTSTDGSLPASGYTPVSSFKVKTFQVLSLFDNNEDTGINFNPFNYSVEGGRQDWIGSSVGISSTAIGENDGDESGQVVRTYYLIYNNGRTIIDFNHPFNASGRITNIYAACTLDMFFGKSKHEKAVIGGAFEEGENSRRGKELEDARIMIFRPKRNGTLDVVYEFDMRNRDRYRGIGDELYALTQEAVEIDVDVFVNKGDFLGIYNANLYVGKSLSGQEIDAQYFQVDGKPEGNFNPGALNGDGSSGVLMYARGVDRQQRLLLDIDLKNRYNIENIEVEGEPQSTILEYNVARCLDINWQVDLFGLDHWTHHDKMTAPGTFHYQRYNVAFGVNRLNDGIKIVTDGLACDSFSLTGNNSSQHWNYDAGPGVVPFNPYYFWVNGDQEWLAVWLHAEWYHTRQKVTDFDTDPIAIYLHFPFEKEKTIYKSIIYFKEKYNFRDFALSTYGGYAYNLGNADVNHYDLVPAYSAITLDEVRYVEDGPLYDEIKDYLFENPCQGGAEVVRNNDTVYEWDPVLSDVVRDYSDLNPYFSYSTGYIANEDAWRSALRTDWLTIQHEWEPITCKGFRIFTDLHKSTKICEIELYCVAEDVGSAFAGGITMRYSDYEETWWPTESVQLGEGLVEIYVGDSPQYFTLEIAPIVETKYDDVRFNIKREDLYIGDKGCQYLHLLEHSKSGAENESQVINIKNVYQNPYDLYVDIAPDKLVEDGITFYSTMFDAEEVNNPLLGPDARYYKQLDYVISNKDNNCAINCHTYGLRNLIQGRTAYYSHDDMITWQEYGQLSPGDEIDFHNLLDTTRTIIILPVISRNRYWKFGFQSPDPSTNVREIKLFDENFELYEDLPIYHDLDKTYTEGNVNYRAPHLENYSVTGSYYTLTEDQYITIDLGSEKTLKAVELVHDGINDYTQHVYDENIVAGIDAYTKLYLLPTRDASGFYLKDYSYYEHNVSLHGATHIVNGDTFTKVESTITIASGIDWGEWHFLTDYASTNYPTTSGVSETTLSGSTDSLYFDLNINNSCDDGAFKFLVPGTDYDTKPYKTKMWQDVPFDITFKLSLEEWQGGKALGLGFGMEPTAGGNAYKPGCMMFFDPSRRKIGVATRQSQSTTLEGPSWTWRNDTGYVQASSATISGIEFLDLPITYVTVNSPPTHGSARNLVDQDLTTYWHDETSPYPGWCKVDLTTWSGSIAPAVKYKLSIDNYNGFMIKDWQLQGSNNDSDWDVLDTRSGEIDWSDYETRTYTFSNSTSYNYYRVYITAGVYPTQIYLRLSEWDLLDSTDTSIMPRPVTANYNSASAAAAMDGNNSTYWHLGSAQYNYPTPWILKHDSGPGQGKTIRQYSLYSSSTTYGPKEWEFQASNDNNNWITLDHQRRQWITSWTTMYFPAMNDTAYRYYRLVFWYSSSDGPFRPFRIYEWKMSEEPLPEYYVRFSSEGSRTHRDFREHLPGNPTNDHDITYRVELWRDAIDGSQPAGEFEDGLNVRWDSDKFGFTSSVITTGSDQTPGKIKGVLSELEVSVDYESQNCPFSEDEIPSGQFTAVRIPDGQSNYVKVDNSVNLDFENRRHTIDFFVKFNRMPEEGERMFIIETDNNIAGWTVAIYLVPDFQHYRIEWWLDGGLREWGGQSGYSRFVHHSHFNPDRWYYILCVTGKSGAQHGFDRGAFFDINGRGEYDDTYPSQGYAKYDLTTGNDIIIGKDFDGWVSSIRLSADYNDTTYTSYGFGGSRVEFNGTQITTARELPVPYKPFDKLYTFSFYVSPDNTSFGHYADVDAFFDDSYSYFEEGSVFAQKYNSYFAIDLDDQHNLDIIRHYGQEDLYYFDDVSNIIYSYIDTTDPREAFITQFTLDPDDDFLGWDSQLPDRDKWEVFGVEGNLAEYIRLRNGYLEMIAEATQSGTHGIKSKYAIRGNFDVEVKFGRSAPDTEAWFSNFGVKFSNGEDGETSVVMDVEYDLNNPAPYYYVRATFTNNGTASTFTVHVPSFTTGMRIIRVSHHFFCLYYESGVWVPLADTLLFDSQGKDVDYVFMSTKTRDNYPSIANYFYEYQVNDADILVIRSDSDNARWIAISMLNGDNTDRFIDEIGIYPEIQQNIVPGGDGFNCEWDDLGPAITAFSEGINVALGTTSSGSSFVSTLDATKAVDGILLDVLGKEFTNVWATDDTSEQWLWLDFGEEKDIYRVKLYHGYDEVDTEYMIEDYYIEVSTDDENYTTIFNITGNGSFERTHDLAVPVTARYLRLYITGYTSKWRYIRDQGSDDVNALIKFEGAVLRQIEVYSYYGYTAISSEEYPIVAINLRDQFYINNHELVGMITEYATYDWDNDDSNFAWSDSIHQDPQKVRFGEFGEQPVYEQWVAIKRNTASYYNADPADELGIDYLKHAIIKAVEEPNPIDHPWWWEADISTLSRDYDKPVELSTSSLRIDYPASDAVDHVRFIEGSDFGVDSTMARRDGVAFRFYIEDIDKFDTSEGYFYWGGVDGTSQRNDLEYRWYWSTLSGTTALQTGWNRPYFRFRNADETIYTPLVNPADLIDPRMREYMTMKTAGLKFKGFGEPFTLNIDGFLIQRNHFNDYSKFGQGLYLEGADYLTTPLGEIDFAAITIEFWFRPDYSFTGLDEFRRLKNRSMFHFGNVINDVVGMLINANGINFYFGNVSDQINGFLIQGLGTTAIDQLWHMGIVFSNNGQHIGSDNSTIRFYLNNLHVGTNYVAWDIQENKSWKFTLGGKAPLALIEFASSLETTSIDGVISDLKIYNYCKTDFSDSMSNIPSEDRLRDPYGSSKLIEISDDNVTFYKVGGAQLPFRFEKVPSGNTVPIYIRSIVPEDMTGYELRTSGLYVSWDVGV